MDFEAIFLQHKNEKPKDKFLEKIEISVKQEFNIIVSEEERSRVKELEENRFNIRKLTASLSKYKNVKNRNSPINTVIRDKRNGIKSQIKELELRQQEIQMERKR
jgi:hypothetical protein